MSVTIAVTKVLDYAHIARAIDEDIVDTYCGKQQSLPTRISADTLQEIIDFDAWHICRACQTVYDKES